MKNLGRGDDYDIMNCDFPWSAFLFAHAIITRYILKEMHFLSSKSAFIDRFCHDRHKDVRGDAQLQTQKNNESLRFQQI